MQTWKTWSLIYISLFLVVVWVVSSYSTGKVLLGILVGLAVFFSAPRFRWCMPRLWKAWTEVWKVWLR